MSIPTFIPKSSTRIGTLAAAAVFCCATAFGQAPTGQMSTPSASTSPNASVQQNGSQSTVNTAEMQQPTGDPAAAMADKLFLKKAIAGSMAEIQVAKLALTKSSNDQVKQFAQKMIDDHGKLLDASKSVATKDGVEVPSGPSKKDQAIYAKLNALSGADFDKAYVKDMVKDHKSDDNDFKTEESNATMPDVKMLATRGEPIIANHLQMIEQLSKSMNAGM